MSERVTPRPVDAADVTIVIDNAIDVLVPNTAVAQRPPLVWDWSERDLPPPSRQDLDRVGWEIVEERGPSLLLHGTVLVTGQVERVTDFEKGFPIKYVHTHDDTWELDRWIWDDQAVVHVRDRGLVILSSCSHSGAINVVQHAQRLTGIDQVHAFVGGLHLTGGLFEPVIGPTVDAMAAIGPAVVVPGHCSGWRAIHALAARLPNSYIQSNVGTRLHFAAALDQ
jgi:7,8-dihydropterin-6-yl-methyl-4-(beta-D-ribofuranosyl)aminobenzene 5'-phosphate synthase